MTGLVSCLSWKWRKRSPAKITERTHEKAKQALHTRKEGRNSEAAFGGRSADLCGWRGSCREKTSLRTDLRCELKHRGIDVGGDDLHLWSRPMHHPGDNCRYPARQWCNYLLRCPSASTRPDHTPGRSP